MSLDTTTLDEMRELMARYPEARSALLPMLHLAQSVEGCVTPEAIETCADLIGISAAEVSGVATFYTMYKRRPMGTHHVGVCTNTLCAVMGGDAIFEKLCGHLGVGNDETSADGAITLERLECNAACDFAPVVMVNWEFFDDQTPETAVELVDQLRSGAEVHSPRGATITSWREAERVLAGFEDGRVDEGPAAGPASLAGLAIAHGLPPAEPAVSAPPAQEPPPPQESGGFEEPRAFRDPSAPAEPTVAEPVSPVPEPAAQEPPPAQEPGGFVEPRAFRDPSAPAEPAVSEPTVADPVSPEPEPRVFVEPRAFRDPSAAAEPRAFQEPRAFKEPIDD